MRTKYQFEVIYLGKDISSDVTKVLVSLVKPINFVRESTAITQSGCEIELYLRDGSVIYTSALDCSVTIHKSLKED